MVPLAMQRELAASDRGADVRTTAVPQDLLWTRLDFPSEHCWRHMSLTFCLIMGCPDSSHMQYHFRISDTVAQARTRAFPIHSLRDPDQIPAPGALV